MDDIFISSNIMFTQIPFSTTVDVTPRNRCFTVNE